MKARIRKMVISGLASILLCSPINAQLFEINRAVKKSVNALLLREEKLADIFINPDYKSELISEEVPYSVDLLVTPNSKRIFFIDQEFKQSGPVCELVDGKSKFFSKGPGDLYGNGDVKRTLIAVNNLEELAVYQSTWIDQSLRIYNLDDPSKNEVIENKRKEGSFSGGAELFAGSDNVFYFHTPNNYSSSRDFFLVPRGKWDKLVSLSIKSTDLILEDSEKGKIFHGCVTENYSVPRNGDELTYELISKGSAKVISFRGQLNGKEDLIPGVEQSKYSYMPKPKWKAKFNPETKTFLLQKWNLEAPNTPNAIGFAFVPDLYLINSETKELKHIARMNVARYTTRNMDERRRKFWPKPQVGIFLDKENNIYFAGNGLYKISKK